MPGMRPERKLRLSAVFLLGLLLLALVPAPPAEAARLTSANPLPLPILGVSTVFDTNGKHVYVFGGRSNASYQATVVKYDPATGQATTLPALFGSGRQSTSAVWAGDVAYIFGGAELVQTTDPNFGTITVPNALKEIVRFDPRTGKLEKVADMPKGAWGMMSVWDAREGVAYVFGGFAFDYATRYLERLDWVLKFRPNAGIGEPKVIDLSQSASPVKLPHPTQDAATAILGSRVYLMGGLTTQLNESGQPVPIISDGIVTFDVDTERISESPLHMPFGFQFAPAATFEGDIYVFGGRLKNASASAKILRYHVDDGIVTEFPLSLKSVRYAMGAATDGRAVWLPGGRDASENIGGLREVLTFYPGVTEPTEARNLRATQIAGGGGLQLRWDAPSYDGGSPLLGYRVYRGREEATTLLATASGTEYRDTTTRPGETYLYRVTALNSAGESRNGVTVQAVAGLRPPSAVEGFEAFAGNGTAFLRWLPPEDTGGATNVAYRIYRANGSDAARILVPSQAATSFTDRNLVNGLTYSYRVTAIGGALEGATSPALSVKPSKDLPEPPRDLALKLERANPNRVDATWAPVPGATDYVVRLGRSVDGLAAVATTKEARATLSGIEDGVLYYVDVQAKNGTLSGPPSAIAKVAAIVAPGAVTNVTAVPGPLYVRLVWDAPNATGGAETVFYEVLRKSASETNPRAIVPLTKRHTGRVWTDNLTTETEYTYWVVAYTVTIYDALQAEERAPESPPAKAAALPAANSPPLAQLDANPVVTARLADVVFDASGSSDPDPRGRVVLYNFDFGDRCGATTCQSGWIRDATITHFYDNDGVYTASVQVQDDRGQKSATVASVQVTVGKPKVVDTNENDGNRSGSNVTNPPVRGPPAVQPRGFLGLPAPTWAAAVAVAALAAVLATRRR